MWRWYLLKKNIIFLKPAWNNWNHFWSGGHHSLAIKMSPLIFWGADYDDSSRETRNHLLPNFVAVHIIGMIFHVFREWVNIIFFVFLPCFIFLFFDSRENVSPTCVDVFELRFCFSSFIPKIDSAVKLFQPNCAFNFENYHLWVVAFSCFEELSVYVLKYVGSRFLKFLVNRFLRPPNLVVKSCIATFYVLIKY